MLSLNVWGQKQKKRLLVFLPDLGRTLRDRPSNSGSERSQEGPENCFESRDQGLILIIIIDR